MTDIEFERFPNEIMGLTMWGAWVGKYSFVVSEDRHGAFVVSYKFKKGFTKFLPYVTSLEMAAAKCKEIMNP